MSTHAHDDDDVTAARKPAVGNDPSATIGLYLNGKMWGLPAAQLASNTGSKIPHAVAA